MGTRLQAKVAIISGGATGMGGAASRLFAAEGAKVAIIDRNEAQAAATAAAINRDGGIAKHWVADVSDEAQVEAAAGGAFDTFGPVTVLSIMPEPSSSNRSSRPAWRRMGTALRNQCAFYVLDDESREFANDPRWRRIDRLHLVDFGCCRNSDGGRL